MSASVSSISHFPPKLVWFNHQCVCTVTVYLPPVPSKKKSVISMKASGCACFVLLYSEPLSFLSKNMFLFFWAFHYRECLVLYVYYEVMGLYNDTSKKYRILEF